MPPGRIGATGDGDMGGLAGGAGAAGPGPVADAVLGGAAECGPAVGAGAAGGAGAAVASLPSTFPLLEATDAFPGVSVTWYVAPLKLRGPSTLAPSLKSVMNFCNKANYKATGRKPLRNACRMS